MKKTLLLLLLTLTVTLAFAEGGLTIHGKIRCVKPTQITLSPLGGEPLLQTELKGAGEFSMGPLDIQPDVYELRIGDFKSYYYLENGELKINGFFDERDFSKNRLTVVGAERSEELKQWIPDKSDPLKKYVTFDPAMSQKLTPVQCAAVAYFSDLGEYAPNAEVYALLSKKEQKTGVGKWLRARMEETAHIALGTVVQNLPFVDSTGREWTFKDLRGKHVVIDFWASWCGPCRREMQSLRPIYEEMKDKGVTFVSVSMDDDRDAWMKMVREEKLPWLMLWNEGGFSYKQEALNEVQQAYGFFQLPFIMLIDKDGRIASRHLRGEAVKEAILKLIENK